MSQPTEVEITFPVKRWGTILALVEDKVRDMERDRKPGSTPRTFQREVVTSREDLGSDRLRIVISTRYLMWFAEGLVSESLKTFLNNEQMAEKEWCVEAGRRVRRAIDPDVVSRIGQLDHPRILIDL